ncbi:hypothetical protein [Bacterioplanoides sp.]|uniref:hypothetical protein n=1 Tax=Bacterioplanoides sp. TaxID=2066072 RepID=UPI003AFF757E
MRFSRRTLNIIIIVCFASVSWIHLGQSDPEMEPLEALTLPPLHDNHWQSWLSQEGISVKWQQVSQPQGIARIVFANQTQLDIPLNAQQWSAELKALAANKALHDTLVILLQGPWAKTEMQGIAAFLIQRLQLQPHTLPIPSAVTHCEQTFAAGSLWFRQHWSQSGSINQEKPLPNRQQWQDFRLQHTQQLRQQWLSNPGQLDIQTDIAYHRPPSDYYQALYQALGDSQKFAASDYLDCIKPQ